MAHVDNYRRQALSSSPRPATPKLRLSARRDRHHGKKKLILESRKLKEFKNHHSQFKPVVGFFASLGFLR